MDSRREEFIQQRHQARALAMQVLYEAETTRKQPYEILQRRRNEENIPEQVHAYASDLAIGVWQNRREYDSLITRFTPTWTIDQMAKVDRNILRIAVHEMLRRNDVPIAAAINEAVELAKEYGAEASPKFVNGVLGAIADAIESSSGGIAPVRE